MSIEFSNESSKQYLARKGPAKVFGWDVDIREKLSDIEAVEWFDRLWTSVLQKAVERASECDLEFVRSKVPHYSQCYIDDAARHREFTLSQCLFICQLAGPYACNQLWFIPSTSGDPRTLYVKFGSVPAKEGFDDIARRLGWAQPEELALRLLSDFMKSDPQEPVYEREGHERT